MPKINYNIHLILIIIFGLLIFSFIPEIEVQASSYISYEYYSNDSYTIPKGITSIIIETWGAGGAGGGSTNAGPFGARGGAGGGGGAYASSTLEVTPGQILQISIGEGGVGAAGENGTNGTPSYVGPDTNPANALVRAAAGSGGRANTAGGSVGGGAGGSVAGSIGDIRIAGEDGEGLGNCFASCSGAGGAGALGGAGGAALCGAYVTGIGNPGTRPGGGGGGGRTSQYNGTRPGGGGAVGKVIITQPFPETNHDIIISSTDCGSVVNPGEGTFNYKWGDVVDLAVEAEDGCSFVNWAGDDVSTIADINSAVTTIIIQDDYSVTANFSMDRGDLTISSTAGGSVTSPGEGTFTYDFDTVVNLVAITGGGYRFTRWTGNVSTIDDIYAAATTITIQDNYSITANFEPLSYNESGTYTVLPGVEKVVIETWGAGGAGGGSTNAGPFASRGGAGGGGGAYARLALDVTTGQVLQVIIGEGGVGAAGENGTNGTPSYVGPDTNPANALVRAAAGSGGRANTAGGSVGGGAGGSVAGSIGDIRIAGEDGEGLGNCFASCSGAGGAGALGGAGGAALCGAYVTGIGNPGTRPGGGGGGGRTSQYNGSRAGGAGAAGKVVITEIILTVEYTLTVSSTDHGSVTEPGEETFTYPGGTVVGLVAEAEPGYHLDSWTGEVSTIANASSAITTITMNDNYSITANFVCTPPTEPRLWSPGWEPGEEDIFSIGDAPATTTFQWIDSDYEDSYEIQLSDDVSFGTFESRSVGPNVEEIDWWGTSLSAGVYYWRVFGINACATVESEIFTFTVDIPQFELNVIIIGDGTVTGPGIDCPGDCLESYASGTSVTLTAAPGLGWNFADWSGAGCSGTGACDVEMTEDRSVTATFNQPPTAAMYCDPASCIIYENDVLSIYNDSTHPDGDDNIVKSEWDIIGVGISPNQEYSGPDNLTALFTPQNFTRATGTYMVQLTVYTASLSDSDTTNITIRQDARADFECSLTGNPADWYSNCGNVKPEIGDTVYFRDVSRASEGAFISIRDWTFEDGNPATSSISNPTTTFQSGGSKEVELCVEDSALRSDCVDKTLNVKMPLPDYRETRPRSQLDSFLARLSSVFVRL